MICLGIGAAVVVGAILLWPRKPEPVVGRELPHHDPKKRKPFISTRSA